MVCHINLQDIYAHDCQPGLEGQPAQPETLFVNCSLTCGDAFDMFKKQPVAFGVLTPYIYQIGTVSSGTDVMTYNVAHLVYCICHW